MRNNISDEKFIEVWNKFKSPLLVSKYLNITNRQVYSRRAILAKKYNIPLPTVTDKKGTETYGWQVPQEPFNPSLSFDVKNGYAFFFGDAHYWPNIPSIAHEALIRLAKTLGPQLKLICANGDLFDGAGISRHEPLGFVKLPTVLQELDEVKTRLAEIERAAPKAKKFFSPGNHDTRFDRRLATEASEFAGVPGFRIQDHLKNWPMAYVGIINEDSGYPVLVMHNFKGGIHAPYNNSLWSASTIVTGHLHSQQRTATTTFFKTCYGVDHGVFADPDSPAFSYTMGRPKNWRSGFAVIKFDSQGRHYPPELVEVQVYKKYKRAVFRGEVIVESKIK